MKRQDLADTIGAVTFIDWVLTPVGTRATAKLDGVPYGRVWLTEITGPDGYFIATIGYERGETKDTSRCTSAFGALADAARLFPSIPAPAKARRIKQSGQGPLFGA